MFTRKATIAAADKYLPALQLATEVTQHLNSTGVGNGTKCWLQLGGTFATLHWTVEFDDLAAMEGAMEALIGDEQYQSMISQGSSYWIAGSTQDAILRAL